MKHNLYSILSALFLSCFLMACSSTVSLPDINARDGIDRKEAIGLAQKVLSGSELNSDYHIKRPKIMTDRLVTRYPGYWFVSFEARSFDKSFWSFLVVISKETGEVIFNDEFVPLEVMNYEWVFE